MAAAGKLPKQNSFFYRPHWLLPVYPILDLPLIWNLDQFEMHTMQQLLSIRLCMQRNPMWGHISNAIYTSRMKQHNEAWDIVRLMQPIRKRGYIGRCEESGCYPSAGRHHVTAAWKQWAGLDLHWGWDPRSAWLTTPVTLGCEHFVYVENGRWQTHCQVHDGLEQASCYLRDGSRQIGCLLCLEEVNVMFTVWKVTHEISYVG